MKLSLTTDIVFKMTPWTIPQPDTKPLDWDEYDPDFDPPSANYLVYDSHNAAPPGFAVRVGRPRYGRGRIGQPVYGGGIC